MKIEGSEARSKEAEGTEELEKPKSWGAGIPIEIIDLKITF